MPSSVSRKQKRYCESVSNIRGIRSKSRSTVGVGCCCLFKRYRFPELVNNYDYNPIGYNRQTPVRHFVFCRRSGLYGERPEVFSDDILGFQNCGLEFFFSNEGAEKSCFGQRRKRGLRKGKLRARGRHPRSSFPPGPPIQKQPNERKINHIGRKFIWATRTNNRFISVIRRRLKSRRPCYNGWNRNRRSLGVWWQQLADRAVRLSIPSTVAFSTSWNDYFNRAVFFDEVAKRRAINSLEDIMVGLPRRDDSPPRRDFGTLFSGISESSKYNANEKRLVSDNANTDSVGNSLYVSPPPVCKLCRGLGSSGPAPGFPKGCKLCYLPSRGKRREPNSLNSRGRRLRRP